MDEAAVVLLMGIIGALIGWVTNVIAIKLLFRPYQKRRIPLWGWELQGLIPKRRKEIAQALGKIVSTELITGKDVALSLGKEKIKNRIAAKINDYVTELILKRLPFVVPSSIQHAIADYAGKIVYQEVQNFLDNPQEFLQEKDREEIKLEIERIVEDKVLSFDLRRLEELVYMLARRELKHIEYLGGFLGFIIGLIQGLITVGFVI